MHIYTIQEVVAMVNRLMNEGMSLKHAVNLTAGSYGFTTDQVYTAIAKQEQAA